MDVPVLLKRGTTCLTAKLDVVCKVPIQHAAGRVGFPTRDARVFHSQLKVHVVTRLKEETRKTALKSGSRVFLLSTCHRAK